MTTNIAETIDLIHGLHRQRRFAMKVQQKLDRSLESFLRINATSWDPDADKAARDKANLEVKALIKRIRDGEQHEFRVAVETCDRARAPADEMRAVNEKAMAAAAKTLPVYPWLEKIHGAGAPGLATIVAEAGDLSDYSKPSKLWKRLGYAPYNGHAGSTWKRESWRPRKLEAEEWTENPFSGERYALMVQIATWLVNAQWIGAKKSGDGEGKPNGKYGAIYARRRAHTLAEHSDWTDGHRRKDAIRFAMKAFLKDLLHAWHESVKPAKRKSRPVEKVAPKRKVVAKSRRKAQK
jgi:hypothetical protein